MKVLALRVLLECFLRYLVSCVNCALKLELLCLSGPCVFLCYFGSRQCCCFPVVRWLDSREDYITLEMCPIIHCCLPPYLSLFFTLGQNAANKNVLFILKTLHVKREIGFLVLSIFLIIVAASVTLLFSKIASFFFPRTGFNN